MKNENILLLNKIITAKSNELGFEIMKPEHSGTFPSPTLWIVTSR